MAEFKRSRLNRQNNDQVTKKTVFLGFLTIVLAIAVLAFGLPLLIKFSIFLGQGKSSASTTDKVLPPLAPRLVLPYEATNSASIDVQGFAEAKVTVELFKNDVSVGKTEVTDSGDFTFSGVSLNEGDNNFSAIASTDKSGSGEKSTPIDLIYDKTPPSLTLTNPSEDNLSVDSADFDITGTTDKGASVVVNDRIAVVDDSGNFKLKWQLNTGKNDLQIIARDVAGNETAKSVSITYSL
jgi:bacillopeptidase F